MTELPNPNQAFYERLHDARHAVNEVLALEHQSDRRAILLGMRLVIESCQVDNVDTIDNFLEGIGEAVKYMRGGNSLVSEVIAAMPKERAHHG